ncbi:MAG: primosomal protein N' [Candidatus Bipolaricaulota bacterium]|nr:primosomal protein N' [Candidatus Bipolaricaulota bacterium]MDW8126757.1 primosomal protein N' [Candidatus Bipolaricaulota bacterium]
MIAYVLLPIPGAAGFDYLVPEGMEVHPGAWVKVPFGKRLLLGVVKETKEKPEYSGELQSIRQVLAPGLPTVFFPLLSRVSEEACTSLGMAIAHIVPKPVRSREHAAALPFSYTEEGKQIDLTPEQEAVAKTVASTIGNPGEYLLFGPPASGKTEVYLAAARVALRGDFACLLLEPEISLLPQLWARARRALGTSPAVYHGELRPGERFRIWTAAMRGEIQCAVGTRSAVFLPFRKLGLVVMDEEGEPGYKEERAPHYHARAVAEARQEEGATVILGAAAPCIETFFRAENGEIRLLVLSKRVAGKEPEVRAVERTPGELIGPELRAAMARHLAQGGQVLLFLNRLGYFTGASCRRCGDILRCPACEVALVFHLAEKTFRCPACGQDFPEPACRRCGGTRFHLFGAGTERVEHEAKKLFPEARVARLDEETAGDREVILSALAKGDLDILVGAQMVGKGLDFPGITLVGVIDADQLLAIPTFYAAERTFQLLVSAIGRAGRGEKPGEVLVQTNMAEHYAITNALRGDYQTFYQEEIKFRKLLRYPPFTRLVKISASGRRAESQIETIAATLREKSLEVLGPAQLHPLRGEPRFQILVRGERTLPKLISEILSKIPQNVRVEPDPFWLG